jgi:hypothetical protein
MHLPDVAKAIRFDSSVGGSLDHWTLVQGCRLSLQTPRGFYAAAAVQREDPRSSLAVGPQDPCPDPVG